MHAVLDWLGRASARRHWWVIGAWLVILAGLLLLRSEFGGEFVNNYTVPGSQSAQGRDVLVARFPQQSGYAGQIVFHAPTGKVGDDSSAVSQSMANVAKLPHVTSASDPLDTPGSPAVSKDGTIVNAPMSFDVVPASLDNAYLDKMDAAVQPARSAGLQVEYGAGAGQVGKQANDLKSEVIGLVLALVLLLFMFASVVAAAIPLLAAVFSVGAGISLLGLLASVTDFPTTAPTVATLLGLGVAVDYGLFLVARHRDQLDEGMSTVESVGRAESTSGAAIVVAGSTVVVAILGLYLSGVPFVGAMGAASAIVVVVTMLSALTLVPAFMGAAGARVRGRAQRRAATAHRAGPSHENSAFARWGRKVSGRPWPWVIAAVGVLVVLAIPLFSIRLGQLDAGTDPPDQSSRKAYDLIAKGFGPGANGPLTVVVELPKQDSSANQALLGTLQQTLSAYPGVAGVAQPTVNSAGDTAVMNVIPTTSPQDAATTRLTEHLRTDVLAKQQEPTYLAGSTAGYVDFTNKVAARMPWLIGGVVVLALILLTVAFRSLVIGVKAAVMNLLSVGAAYGVVVAVFQYGWGSSLVGIHETLPIPSFVPMLMFAIVFGLSMDYEVFLLSRVHEAYVKTGDGHRSVAIGIGATARVITTAAAIMIVVFTSFVLSDDATVKMLAVGMAVAVLIDATVVRMILVPAVMAVLGRHAWWLPHWLDRILPDLQLEGGTAPAPAGEQEVPGVQPGAVSTGRAGADRTAGRGAGPP
jgi:RND superfamily putative drug exporter